MQLKVGDRVFVRQDLQEYRRECRIGITDTMIKVYAGQQVVICKIQTTPLFSDSPFYRIRLLHGNDYEYNFVWTAQMFDLSTVFANGVSIY